MQLNDQSFLLEFDSIKKIYIMMKVNLTDAK